MCMMCYTMPSLNTANSIVSRLRASCHLYLSQGQVLTEAYGIGLNVRVGLKYRERSDLSACLYQHAFLYALCEELSELA